MAVSRSSTARFLPPSGRRRPERKTPSVRSGSLGTSPDAILDVAVSLLAGGTSGVKWRDLGGGWVTGVAGSTSHPVPSGTVNGDLTFFWAATKDWDCTVTSATYGSNAAGVASGTTASSTSLTGDNRIDLWVHKWSGTPASNTLTRSKNFVVTTNNSETVTTSSGLYYWAATTAVDSTGTGTTISATGASTLNILGGDSVFVFGSLVGAYPLTLDLTIPGCTLDSGTGHHNSFSDTDPDLGWVSKEWKVTSGAATGPPSLSGDTYSGYGASTGAYAILVVRDGAQVSAGPPSRSVSVSLTATGAVGYTGSASLSATASTTASGSTDLSAAASDRSQTVTVTAAGTVGTLGNASLTAQFLADPIQQYSSSDRDITLGTVFPLGLAPAVNVDGNASLAETVSVTSAGAMGYTTGTTVSPAVSITTTATVGRIGNTSLTETVSITATGNKAASGDASRASTVSTTSAGTVGRIGDATLSESVTITSTATNGVTGGASLSESVTITAAGAATGLNNAALTVNTTVTAAGLAQYQQGASLTAAVSLTTAGTVGRFGGASPSETVTVTATGTRGVIGSSSPTANVTVTTDGSRIVNGSAAAVTPTVTVTAAGIAVVPTPLNSYMQANVLASASGFLTVRRALFSPPTRDNAYGRKVAPKAWWVEKEEGISLIKEGGVWRQTVNPSNDEVVNAERCYLGGRIYRLDATQESELIAAGYGDLITEEYVNV